MRSVVAMVGLSLAVFGCSGDDTTVLPAPGLPDAGTGGATTGTTTGGATGGTTGGATGGTTGGDTGGTTGGDTFCPPGYTFCNGNTLFTCNAQGEAYDSRVCGDGCVNGACSAECTPGEVKCLGPNLLGTCQQNGSYQSQTCTQGVCKNGQCTSDQSLCTPNSLFCEPGGNKLLKCSQDGQTASDFKNCPYGCDEQTLDCKAAVCEPDSNRCAPDAPNWIETCKQNGTGWTKVQGCSFECNDGVCVTAACTAGETQCGSNAVMECASDQKSFQVKETCPFGCGTDGPTAKAACRLCQEGTKWCKQDPSQAWMKTKCEDQYEGYVDDVACGTDPANEEQLTTCSAGDCISMIYFDGELSELDNHVVLMKAFLECSYQGQDGVCKGLYTQNIDYDISFDDLHDSFCDEESTKALFDSEAQYDDALDLLGCTELFDQVDITFHTGSIHKKLDGTECYAFSAGGGLFSNSKEIIVDNCWKFSKHASQ